MVRALSLSVIVCGACARPAPAAVEAAPGDDDDVYPVDEAVMDALSGSLTFIGKGKWHGIYKIPACAYRNDRVLVVDVYCTANEMSSFRVDVFHPARGRVRIYAEGDAPISTVTRSEYSSFRGFSEPPAPPERLAAPSLAMSFAELQAYQKARNGLHLPACWEGTEAGKPSRGCYQMPDASAPRFAARNGAFFDDPPDAWYQLVRRMIELRRR